MKDQEALERLGIVHGARPLSVVSGSGREASGARIDSVSPATAEPIASVRLAGPADHDAILDAAHRSFLQWREVPAPRRGALVRLIGELLRERKTDLGHLVSLECGKIISEGEGEVQEMIDIADLAVGLSRQLYGLTMHSERPHHRLYEQWHPLGPIGVITSFNFPVAVWAWNAMIAAVCGDTVVWKPSEKTPLCAIAVQRIADAACDELGLPRVFFLAGGDADVGRLMAADPRLPLVSATGSCGMGRDVAIAVSTRLGRALLELGGNNAAIVLADADLDLVLRAVTFAAAGTAGQRCTTLRRLLVEVPIADEVAGRLEKVYRSLADRIGDPCDRDTLVGPLIDAAAVERFEAAVRAIEAQGGEILAGGRRVDPERLDPALRRGHFVEPTLVRSHREMAIVREEVFAPILHIIPVRDLEEAIELQNDVPQGLSSAIFTRSLAAAERFLGPAGSDCGIANVNIGTSGAEIGGAFGGEKETGGGREAGSDAWKAYMRRQTCTINWGRDLPLAQGVEFDV